MVEESLTDLTSEKNVKTIKDHLNQLSSENGSFSNLKMWQLKKKLLPREKDLPMGKKDEKGVLITSHNELLNLYLRTYQHRLRQRDMRPELNLTFELKNMLWDNISNILSIQKSEPWNMTNLNKVLSKLKNNKSRDPMGLCNELFKPGCAGEGLKIILLQIFDQIKTEQRIPEIFKWADIHTIYKKKGSRSEMKNDRGIFILSLFHQILDKLIYNDIYPDIARNMSDSNIGAQSDKNIKNHLFVIYGLIHSFKNANKCLDIMVFDLVEAFDSLWLQHFMIDLYKSSSTRNDKMRLLYLLNKENKVAVNTPVGQTDRKTIRNLVMQGSTPSSLLCSNSCDKIGKECIQHIDKIDRGIPLKAINTFLFLC